jgi:hypothetical protein
MAGSGSLFGVMQRGAIRQALRGLLSTENRAVAGQGAGVEAGGRGGRCGRRCELEWR